MNKDPPEVDDQEEVLQPEAILQHEDKVLRHGKVIQRYLVKLRTILLKMLGGCKEHA